ncbi:MAG: HNH endonuclease [Gemmataceae bacterium]|nr:HNH endonuclease [Gemmata sp.]MDW8198729.1 HNH endonuclease [Gemmataceae bacterium]
MKRSEPTPCGLCDRLFEPGRLTQHHCLPKSKGGTSADVALICSQCHGMIHATYTNSTLARQYPTLAQLRAAPELAPFLRWVRKQPASRKKRNRPRRRKL